ncbi:hypothetical protein DIRU0_C22056 [Diutina rugosa]
MLLILFCRVKSATPYVWRFLFLFLKSPFGARITHRLAPPKPTPKVLGFWPSPQLSSCDRWGAWNDYTEFHSLLGQDVILDHSTFFRSLAQPGGSGLSANTSRYGYSAFSRVPFAVWFPGSRHFVTPSDHRDVDR